MQCNCILKEPILYLGISGNLMNFKTVNKYSNFNN